LDQPVGSDEGRRGGTTDAGRRPSPGIAQRRDNTLRAAELIVGIELPRSPFAEHSWYLKVRDRHSYAFALVSVAAGLRIEHGMIEAAAIALGGVAAMPWRVAEAEAGLIGQSPTEGVFRRAAERIMVFAQPLSQNAFKVDLGRHSVVRALSMAQRVT
jgi:xanthine dehydrogenase YagS FAD-binding subunit